MAGASNSKSPKANMKRVVAKESTNSAHKGKKISPKPGAQRYSLRSALDGVRVLRSMSNGKSNSPVMSDKSNSRSRSKSKSKSPVKKSVSLPVQPVTERRKKKKVRKVTADEFSKIRNRIYYLLKRISYEQNLIDAYSGEGWRGQRFVIYTLYCPHCLVIFVLFLMFSPDSSSDFFLISFLLLLL